MSARMNKRAAQLIAYLLLCALALSGCSMMGQGIAEDGVNEGLPDIDPEAGIAREVTATVYYRLTEEAYLVGISHSIAVRSSEQPEAAIVRTLLAGVPPLSSNVSAVFPEGTEAVDVSLDGSILYVTLSEEFLDESTLERARSESGQLLSSGLLTQEQYDARIAAAQRELYTQRRMGAYAIANSLTAYRPGTRVQLYVVRGGSSERMLRYELGLTGGEETALVEPMSFVEEAVATPASVLESVLTRWSNGEYAKIYNLFAETETGGGQKPAYADFETRLYTLGRVSDFTIRGYRIDTDVNYAYVTAEIELVDESGNTRSTGRLDVRLKAEGYLYKVCYYALTAALEGN